MARESHAAESNIGYQALSAKDCAAEKRALYSPLERQNENDGVKSPEANSQVLVVLD